MARMDWDRVKAEDRSYRESLKTVAKGRKRRRRDGRPSGFEAKYGGTCCICREKIKPGDRITMWSRPKVAHVLCVPAH